MSKETQPAGEVRSLVDRLRGGVYGIDRIALCAEAADEIERLREALEIIAAQHSGEMCSTKRSDCMAAIAAAALAPTPRQMARE